MFRAAVVVLGAIAVSALVGSILLLDGGGAGEVGTVATLAEIERRAAEGGGNIVMFPTQGIEYLVALIFLVVFCFFWRVLTVKDEKETLPQAKGVRQSAVSTSVVRPAKLKRKGRRRENGAEHRQARRA